MGKAPIIVVDDDTSMRAHVSWLLSDAGYAVNALANGAELLERLTVGPVPALILLDVVMPEGDGLSVIEKVMNTGLEIPVIMLSGMTQVSTVVQAMKLGASDFLPKPVDEKVLLVAVQNVLEGNFPKRNPGEFVTANPRMVRLAHILKRVAPTDVPILLLGETGVGKEVMARYAHDHSGRGDKPFVKVNCAALPDGLLESELFGYEQGAFTGAVSDKTGKFEQANTGTLLLDEIGEMSPHLQAKLLHVLQDGTYSRLGGTKSVRVDARVMASTNIDIKEGIRTGKFREDLYFRLNVISIDLPPLRERKEDIPALCSHFIAKYGDRYGGKVPELPPDLMTCFMEYDWRGNIRQLENCIRQFLVLPGHHSLYAELKSADKVPENMLPTTPIQQAVSLLSVEPRLPIVQRENSSGV
jgi:two-component system response regulator AtoC